MSFRFQNFKVYQDAFELNRRIIKITRVFPRDFNYLKDQMRRASLSIVLQIAEGFAKESDRDFNRYLLIALGSVNEVAASLEVACVVELITNETFEELLNRCDEVKKQLGGFSKKLKVVG